MYSREYLKQTIFSTRHPLNFSCPTCHSGQIKIVETDIQKKKTASEKRLRDNLDYTNSTALKFTSMPICDFCGEVIIVAGVAGFYASSGSQVSSEYIPEKHVRFMPQYFSPPLNIFIISSYCPRIIKLCILNAFSHYWNDLPSTVNRIRTSVELIMDHIGIEKANTLHSRIEKYQKINSVLGKRLMALKWLGNTGSHADDISKDDVLNGFELLESIIEELFERPYRDSRLNELSDDINTSNEKKRHK